MKEKYPCTYLLLQGFDLPANGWFYFGGCYFLFSKMEIVGLMKKKWSSNM